MEGVPDMPAPLVRRTAQRGGSVLLVVSMQQGGPACIVYPVSLVEQGRATCYIIDEMQNSSAALSWKPVDK